MTQLADAIADAGPSAHQPRCEVTTTKPDALSALLARQRAAFLREGPPSLAQRQASLQQAARGGVVATAGFRSGARCRLRASLQARNRDHGNAGADVGNRLPARAPPPLHAARAAARRAADAPRLARALSISRSV